MISADQKSIKTLIDFHAEQTPDNLFLIDPDASEVITFGELKNRIERFSSALFAQNINVGETVAYAMGNETDTAIAILGIMYGGHIATAINLVAGRDIISYVLKHSETKLVVCNQKGAPIVTEALSNASGKIPILGKKQLFEGRGTLVTKNSDPEPSSDGLLMYTSGTTGRPKGVVLTHANLVAGGWNAATAHQLTKDDRGICVLPLYHINGLCVTLMGALVSGGSLVIPNKFSVGNFWPTIITQECSWFSVVPTQISYLLHSDAKRPEADELQKVRFGRSASAPLSPEVQQAFETKFSIPIVETMGLTETSAQILSNPLPPQTRKVGSPGIACGNEIMIADNQQVEVGRGVEGELLVRGPNVMRCYLKNEEATRQAITVDGWLRTGDLGRMDEDGYLFITGRLKELIIKGGENIAPREIDEALYTHPDVVEAAAFARKCDKYGEKVEAAVMLKDGSLTTEDDLKQICILRIGAFKSPDRVHFLPELPKGPSGKIQRRLLISLLSEF